MKAKITYLGGPETGDIGHVTWGDYEFELNKPVTVDDEHTIGKAKNNKFFKVQMLDDGAPDDEPEPDEDEPKEEEKKAPTPHTSRPVGRPPSRLR